jgi:hypothetical protein
MGRRGTALENQSTKLNTPQVAVRLCDLYLAARTFAVHLHKKITFCVTPVKWKI